MKRIIQLLIIGTLVLPLLGCSSGSSADQSSPFQIRMSVTPSPASIKSSIQLQGTLNESVISQGSWFMFEIRTPKNDGPSWVPATYEGNGIFTGSTTLPTVGNYQIWGHFYAGGGIHFSKKYSLQVTD